MGEEIATKDSVSQRIAAGAHARERARGWFKYPVRSRVSSRYDERETATSRSLCLEVGLALCGRPPSRLLDVGCGGGALLERAREVLPEAELAGVDPVEPAIAAAERRFGGDPGILLSVMAAEDLARQKDRFGHFDLILVHLSLALWNDPLQGLTRLTEMLAPGGTCYVVDLLRPESWDGKTIPEGMGAADEEERDYLRDQLAASLAMEEFRGIADETARRTGTRARYGGAGSAVIRRGRPRRAGSGPDHRGSPGFSPPAVPRSPEAVRSTAWHIW